jgi:hypothetical protein
MVLNKVIVMEPPAPMHSSSTRNDGGVPGRMVAGDFGSARCLNVHWFPDVDPPTGPRAGGSIRLAWTPAGSVRDACLCDALPCACRCPDCRHLSL